MKTFLILTVCLMSGPVGCVDIIGYPGGTVNMYCVHEQYGVVNPLFCKLKPEECISVKTMNKLVQEGRLSLRETPGALIVIYRNLKVEDSGSYQCRENGNWSLDMNLTVNTDPCCLGPKTVTGFLGETVTINCSYPEEFEKNNKFLYKQDGQDFDVQQLIRTTDPQSGRFSISEDRRSKAVSVRIRDVREDDGGVYFCGAECGGASIYYYSLFTEIHLQVTAQGSSSIIITVCVCVTLLLIGGSALIFYKLRSSRRPGRLQSTAETSNTADGEYENGPSGNWNRMRAERDQYGIYQNQNHTIDQSESVYQSLDPNTTQSESVYQSLDPNTTQPESVY